MPVPAADCCGAGDAFADAVPVAAADGVARAPVAFASLAAAAYEALFVWADGGRAGAAVAAAGRAVGLFG